MDKELPTSVWPEWKIIEKIGEGSFGKVYKAQRTEQGRAFYSAIKIINIPGSADELNSAREEISGDDSVLVTGLRTDPFLIFFPVHIFSSSRQARHSFLKLYVKGLPATPHRTVRAVFPLRLYRTGCFTLLYY